LTCRNLFPFRWVVLSDVVGQEEGVAYLRRIVEGQTQSLILVGEEGVGRKFAVTQAFKEIVVRQRGLGSSETTQVDRGVHADFTVVTAPAEKEIGVDAIREAVAQALSYPSSAPCRFFVIDGADRLTDAAANALLKTLEEPPALSRFFLLAESYARVLPTIRSRCGRVRFRKLPELFILDKIAKFEEDRDKALVYSRMGEGSVGRAIQYWGANRISVRDQALAVLRAGVAGDLSGSFASIDSFGKDLLPLGVRFLCFLTHDLLVSGVDPQRAINLDILDDLTNMRDQAPRSTWFKLWRELKVVLGRYESVYVSLAFQAKTALASTFCE